MENDKTTDNIDEDSLTLSSTRSMHVSLEAVRSGRAGLDAHRQKMLDRVSETGDWARFELNSIDLKDLAYLTAKVGDEFALLRGKHEDILFHGDKLNCHLAVFENDLKRGKYTLEGHSHPGEEYPVPSDGDRDVLKKIGQKKSFVISARTGIAVDFGQDKFEIL